MAAISTWHSAFSVSHYMTGIWDIWCQRDNNLITSPCPHPLHKHNSNITVLVTQHNIPHKYRKIIITAILLSLALESFSSSHFLFFLSLISVCLSASLFSPSASSFNSDEAPTSGTANENKLHIHFTSSRSSWLNIEIQFFVTFLKKQQIRSQFRGTNLWIT